MKKWICCALAALCMACFLPFGQALAADIQSKAAETVSVDKTFDLMQTREGRYADWSCFKTDEGLLSERKYYNGRTFASTGGLKNGWLYETTTEGATVTLLDRVYGDFSLLGQALQEVYQNSSPGWNKDYRGITLIFTDLADPTNVMEFRFEETAYNYAAVTAVYRGEEYPLIPGGESGVSICTPLFDGAAYATPFCFRFDPAARAINCGQSSDVVEGNTFSFAEAFPEFSGFGSYSAQMRFSSLVFKSYYTQDENGNWIFDYEGNGAYRTAKFVIYELCGQLLSGETPADTAAPMIGAEFPDCVAGQPLDLSVYVGGYDVLDGEIADFTFSVKDPAGQEVAPAADGKTFTPAVTGTHTVTVTARDSANNVSEKTFNWEVTLDITDPVLSFSKTYGKNYPVGYELEIVDPAVRDNVDEGLSADCTVYFGEQTLTPAEGKITLSQKGSYKIVYTVQDEAGNAAEQTFTFSAVDMPSVPANGWKVAASQNMQYVPMLSVPEGWSYTVGMYAADDAQQTDLLQGGLQYKFESAGEYVLVYSIILEKETAPSMQVTAKLVVEGNAVDPSDPADTPAGGLQGWQIALIVVGCVIVAAGIGAVVWLKFGRKKKDDKN